MTSRPDVSDVLVGRFGLADDQHKVPGRLTLAKGLSPRLELDESLTPPLKELDRQEQPDGTVERTLVFAEDGPDHESLVVHGELDDGDLVTLVDAFTSARKHTVFAPDADQNRQWLKARSALLGGHIGSRNEVYTRIRLQLRHLDAWAALAASRGRSILVRAGQQSRSEARASPVSLADGGQLDLEQVSETEFSKGRGGRIGRVLWLRIVDLPPMTADDLDRRFVTPLATLLTLATDTDCPPVAVEIATGAEQPWLTVHHSGLRAAAEEVRPTYKQLLPLEALGLDRVATWLGAVEKLGPLPAAVAAAVAGQGRTLETQLLELSTVAEGLHRRLFPDSRRLSDEQAEAARQAAKTAVEELDESVRTAMEGALKHLEEPSFPQRLAQLAESVAATMPSVTGQTNRWKRCVTKVRNDLAHRSRFLEMPSIDELLAVRGSLRWLLTGLLLLQTGLPREELAARFEVHQPYMSFRRQARGWLPPVFQAPSA